ncbi:hypothetical protein CHU93_05725 [Sandarakinorhabdus cyanobacteriorum]|uniref:Uncharacterized protein n=1 Tax=Sandarakinorhabdus cyanobacteriorum TaxID=1981098 RepID=A0A255YQN4_9SPHN|nr:hypothetical protein CHU93_05725 [Sandarakinorhabdus cyanobacteriorum]
MFPIGDGVETMLHIGSGVQAVRAALPRHQPTHLPVAPCLTRGLAVLGAALALKRKKGLRRAGSRTLHPIVLRHAS